MPPRTGCSKPQVPGHRDVGAECQGTAPENRASLSERFGFPSSEMGHCGVLGSCTPGLDNLMPLVCERPHRGSSSVGIPGSGQGWNPAWGSTQRTQPPTSAQCCPCGLTAWHLILQGKRWSAGTGVRSALGPGAASETLEDEQAEAHTGTFCLGERGGSGRDHGNKAEGEQGG